MRLPFSSSSLVRESAPLQGVRNSQVRAKTLFAEFAKTVSANSHISSNQLLAKFAARSVRGQIPVRGSARGLNGRPRTEKPGDRLIEFGLSGRPVEGIEVSL